VADPVWHWTPWVPAMLLYVAIGPSLIAYRCWGLGVSTVGPAIAAFFGNLTPVFAAVMSAALLGESPQWFHLLAFGLIVAGIWVSSRR
jgi:drug/metabolite transporter (DMT)-like permease